MQIIRLSQQDSKLGFEKVFDEMVNQMYKSKLLTSHNFTHISIGLQRVGSLGESFRIGIVLTNKRLCIEQFMRCENTIDSGLLIVGRILDPTFIPCILVINRGRNGQIIVGPNKMSYNQLHSDEFKVSIPESYLGIHTSVSQTLLSYQGNNVEIFLTTPVQQDFNYGQGDNIPQTFNDWQNLMPGIIELVPSVQSMLTVKQGLGSTMKTEVLKRDNANQQKLPFTAISQNKQTTFPSVNPIPKVNPDVRKTKTQLLREKFTHSIKRGSLQQSQTLTNNAFQSLNQNTNSVQNLYPVMPFQRFNTIAQTTAGSNGQFPFSQPNFNTTKKENENPNMQAQTNLNKPLQFNFSLPSQQQIPSSSQGAKIQISQNVTKQQQTINPSTQSIQQPNLPNFQFIQPSSNQVQSKQEPTFNQAQNTNQFQFQFQTIHTPNNQIQQQVQPQINTQYQNSSQYQPIIQQPIQQPQIQLTQPIAQQPIQQQNYAQLFQNLQAQNKLVFEQLSNIDQHILYSYLLDLQQSVNPDQLKYLHNLMLTDPESFIQNVQSAHQEMQRLKLEEELKAKDQADRQRLEREQFKNRQLKDLSDIYIFIMTLPESLKESKKSKVESIIQQLSEGKLDQQEALHRLIVRSKFPVNESFKNLLNKESSTDVILFLNKEEYHCHSFVLSANSSYFQKVIDTYPKVYDSHSLDRNSKHHLQVPGWMNTPAFKLLLKFFYTGRITDPSGPEIPQLEILDLLLIATYFHIDFLQEQLVAQIIIPKMNPFMAPKYLCECLYPTKVKQGNKRLWNYLKEYCIFYIGRNLAKIVKTDREQLRCIKFDEQKRLIELSLEFIKGTDYEDLELILNYTASLYGCRNIYDLFRRCNQHFESCSAFDYQIVPLISEFLQTTDPYSPYQCPLVQGNEMKYQDYKKQESLNDKDSAQEKPLDKFGSSFFIKEQKIENYGSPDLDLNNWKPSQNIVRLLKTDSDLIELAPGTSLQAKMDLSNIAKQIEQKQGATIFSDAFDIGRRSWIIKIDIDKDNNLSMWLVERGSFLKLPNKFDFRSTSPLNMSSVLFDLQVEDPLLGGRKSSIFFSFAHDSNQIIGIRNFFNIQQLKKKDSLEIQVSIKEFFLHSAMMHYFITKFYQNVKKEIQIIKQYFKNPVPTGTFYQNENLLSPDSFFNLPFYIVFQILSSHHLQVEEEKQVLLYLYHYVQRMGDRQIYGSTDFIVDMLVQTLRFTYLPINQILSALRDNCYLRKSKAFQEKVKQEFHIRSNNFGIPRNQVIDEPLRLHYNTHTVLQESRLNPNYKQCFGQSQMTLIEDILSWAFSSKHQKLPIQSNLSSSIPTSADNARLMQLLREERRNNQLLFQEVESLKEKMKKNKQSNQIINNYLRHSDKKKSKFQGRFQDDSVIDYGRNKGRDSPFLNGSVQSIFKFSPDKNLASVIKAEQKIRNNAVGNLSELLENYNKPKAETKTQQPRENQYQYRPQPALYSRQRSNLNEPVPYFRQKQIQQRQNKVYGSSTNNDCSIF